MTTPTQRRFDSYQILRSVSITTPAIRLVVVEAWAVDDQVHHRVHPVIAILARLGDDFSRPHRSRDYHRPPTPARAEAEGWTHQGSGLDFDAVVMSDELGGLTPASLAFYGCNVAHQVVAAPWSPEEDGVRLAEVIATVEAEAIDNARPSRSEAAHSL